MYNSLVTNQIGGKVFSFSWAFVVVAGFFMNGLANSIHADIAKIVVAALVRNVIIFFMWGWLSGFELLE
jgi:hypothetical protein